MAQTCRQLTGAAASGVGWVGLIVATATNDWVRTCDYTVATCIRMDELESHGLWAECVISPSLYHCVALSQVLTLPAYVQTSRALMVCASLLGLPALLLVLMSSSCIRLQNDDIRVKKLRARVGGAIFILMALFGVISTVWFPVGAHQAEGLMSFGFSLYAGWVGSGLCLVGGATILCCYALQSAAPAREKSIYYSRGGGASAPLDLPSNRARSARV
ncbi:claudin-11-like [Gouania willdenowi]|uniref:Claudin n=1 Tax=Gouania willdenowi TaxID=441366 RepID=A0A8C5H0S9_GOUWI|nr:claudin-11-like [Gouania willdenowi]XP_028289847.1 claudin-11-like [Gouania willdenowi]